MTTILSQKGQIVLPSAVREQMDLHPGDDFEVIVEDDERITLRLISKSPNRGLVDHLLARPETLDIPQRSRSLARQVGLGDED